MIRVLIAEDSASARAYLQHLVNSAPDMEVVAVAVNGAEAARLTCELRPDVVAMDIHMPVMDGYSATREIMAKCPTPVVIVSALISGKASGDTFRIFEAGAVAAVTKPHGPGTEQAMAECEKLVTTLRQMAGIDLRGRAAPVARHEGNVQSQPNPCAYRLVAIGASTGGPIALKMLLQQLPAQFALPVLVVQHISPGFITGMVTWLSQSCALPIKVAEDQEKIQPGHVYFAPDNCHMTVNRQGRICCVDAPPMHSVRPAVSWLFQSVAEHYAATAVGVLLTGMGRDGAQELLAMQQRGAVTLLQDQASCVVYGMPGEAAQLGVGNYHLPPEKIGQQLAVLCGDAAR